MKNAPLVSVVALSWNGGADLESCIQHILSQTYRNIELIIVDNGSTDGSLELVQPLLGNSRVLRNRENQGFARGMNQGIELSSGEYVLLLNQDAFLSPDFVQRGVEVFDSDERIGMLAARVLDSSRGHKTQSLSGAGMLMRKRMKPVANLDERELVLGPTWCCAFIRRATLEDIRCPIYGDYLDEDYFAYQEDVDFNMRTTLRGWACPYVPTMVAWHSVSTSVGGHQQMISKPAQFRQHALKNRYLTVIKDVPAALLLRWSIPLLMAEVGLWFYLALRAPSAMLDLLRAYRDVVRLLPKAIRRRRAIQGRRLASTQHLAGFFTGF